MKSKYTRFLGASASFVIVLSSSAFAAPLTWDSTGANPTEPLNGAGTWDTTNAFWSNGVTDVVWNNANGDTAVFGGGTSTGSAGAVTLGTAITAGGLTFNLAGYDITGGSLTLVGTPAVNAAADATVSSVVAGSDGLTKTGAGILTLSGENTFTGSVNVSSGTLRLGNAAALGATSGTFVSAGATLDMNGTPTAAGNTITIAGTGVAGSAITGGGNIEGNLVLSGDATIGSNAAADLQLGTGTSPATITGAYTLTKIGSNRVWYRGTEEGAGNSLAALVINEGTFGVETNNNALNGVAVTVNTGGIFSSWGNASSAPTSQNNPITLAGGTLGSDLGGQNYTGDVTLTADSFAGATSSAANFTISGHLSGAFTLEKQTTSNLTLSNANVDVAAINVTGGRLTLNRNAAGGVNLGSTNIILGTGREMVVAIGTGVSGGTITMGAGSSLGIQNGNPQNGGAGFASNIVLASGSGAEDAASIGGFIYGNSTTLSGTISGTGDLRWRNDILGGGRNSATLRAANNTSGWAVNSYSGATSFEGVNLTFALASNANNDVINPFGASGNVMSQTAGRLRFLTTGSTNNTSIIENAINFSAGDGGTTEFFREDGNLRLSGNVNVATTGTGQVMLNSMWGSADAKGLELTGVLSGNGNLTVTRTTSEQGAVHLGNNNNTYNGTITVNNARGAGGILVLDADGAGTNANINLASAGAHLNVNTGNATIASLTGIAGSQVSARTAGQTLTVDQATDTTFAGAIGGTGIAGSDTALNLVKIGAGSLNLTGKNVHTGTTTVSAGTLFVNGALTNSAVTVNGSGILAGADTISNNITIATSGKIAPGNSIGTLTAGGDVNLSGTLEIEYGTVNIDMLAVLGTLDLTGSTVSFVNLEGTLDGTSSYTFASYGTLLGAFGTTSNVPTGYTVDYAFNGNNIALVVIPEPSVALLGALGCLALLRRRRN